VESMQHSKLETYRRNLISFTLVNIFWQMGSTLMIPETSLIFFISYLGVSNMIIGLIVPIFMVFGTAPGIIWGAIVKNGPKMRKFLIFSWLDKYRMDSGMSFSPILLSLTRSWTGSYITLTFSNLIQRFQ